MATHNKVGVLGEDIACRYLGQNGLEMVARNYARKWGEIDIVARETHLGAEILHFIEVKTVTREIGEDISRVTFGSMPEENVHEKKIGRLKRAIQTYLMENRISHETQWEFSICAVFLDQTSKRAIVRYTRNVVL